jgi:hypothetical protein
MSVSREELLTVIRMLQALPVPWFVCGGWAIDLFAGQQTREHSDLEIGLFRDDQLAIRRHFLDWHPGKVVDTPDGPTIVPWYEGEWLMLPIHQVKLYQDGFRPREFEFMLNDADDRLWHFRRMPEISIPRDNLVRVTDDDIYYVAPEVQLLFKARLMRGHDRADFEVALPLLDEDGRRWLWSALQRFLPGHEWIERLQPGSRGGTGSWWPGGQQG